MKKKDMRKKLKAEWKRRTLINMPEEMYEVLKDDSEKGFRSLSKQVVMIVSHYYAEKHSKINLTAEVGNE